MKNRNSSQVDYYPDEDDSKVSDAKRPDRSIVWFDPNDVPGEWEKQPDLAFELGNDYAEETYNYDTAKVEVERAESYREDIEAQVLLRVKKDFKEFGFEKDPPMELAKAAVADSEQYRKATEKVFKAKDRMNKAKRDMALAYSAVQACKDRKSALEKAVDLLWLMGPGGTPRAKNPEAAEYARARAAERAAGKPKKHSED